MICCVCLGLLLRIEWERRTVLGSEEVEFSEADFAEEELPPPFALQEPKHGR
ncbi:hypothetical protein FQZ97_749260 [compost metagenome]